MRIGDLVVQVRRGEISNTEGDIPSVD